MEERELILRAGRGEEDAFSDLVKCYVNQVYDWLKIQTGNPGAAHAFTVETFQRAWNAVGLFQFDQPFEDWLISIAEDASKGKCPKSADSLEPGQDELCREIMSAIHLETKRSSPAALIKRFRFTLLALVIAALLLLCSRLGLLGRSAGQNPSAPSPSPIAAPQVSAAFQAGPSNDE